MVELLSDFRYAARSLFRKPALVAITSLLLGLAIGAGGVFFSVVDALLLRQLPVRAPQELVRLVTIAPNLGARSYFAPAVWEAVQQRCGTLHDVFAWTDLTLAYVDAGDAERVNAEAVSGNYFAALGVAALLGRTIEPADDGAGRPVVAVLSHSFWQRKYGGDAGVLGRTIRLQQSPATIVGVLPPGFNGVSIDTSADVRIAARAAPLMAADLEYQKWTLWSFSVGARLRPGATLMQARDEAYGIVAATMDTLPTESGWRTTDRIDIEPLSRGTSMLRSQFGTAASVLLAGVCFLMLIVCANIAGLMLARSVSRQHEWAVRMAAGATRLQIARLMMTESLLIAACGLAAGLVAAMVALPLLARSIPPVRTLDAVSHPMALQLRLDWRVFLFACALGLGTALVVGIVPAWQAGREDLHSLLKSVRASGRSRGRSSFVVVQVGLCTMLLAGAALFWETFRRLDRLDPGFDRQHVVTFSVDPSMLAYTPEQTTMLQDRLLEGVRAMPGVRAAGIGGRGVMRGTGLKTTVAPEGGKAARSDFLNTSINSVSHAYFEAMGISLLEGRDYASGEKAPEKPPLPIIVNRAFVRRFYPDGRALGRRFGTGVEKVVEGRYEIIGVVGDAKYRSFREPIPPTMYGLWPRGGGAGPFILHVRTHGDPAALIGPVRELMHGLDPRLPFIETRTLSAEVEDSLWKERLLAWLSLAFSVLAVLLAATGVYGLLAQFVAMRSREIGIRGALGASPVQIVALIGRHAALLMICGLAAGLLAAFAGVKSVRPLLYGVETLQVPTLGLLVLVMALAGGAAGLIPAARAARIDPAETLRAE